MFLFKIFFPLYANKIRIPGNDGQSVSGLSVGWSVGWSVGVNEFQRVLNALKV
jgi:hypothetical protein